MSKFEEDGEEYAASQRIYDTFCPFGTTGFSMCPAVIRENNAGGEARVVVAHVADLLGIKLSEDIVDGNIWSSANMRRVIPALTKLKYGAKVVVNESKPATINIHHSPPPAAAASVIPRYLQESMRRRSW